MCKHVNIFVFWSYQCCAGALKVWYTGNFSNKNHLNVFSVKVINWWHKFIQKNIHITWLLCNAFLHVDKTKIIENERHHTSVSEYLPYSLAICAIRSRSSQNWSSSLNTDIFGWLSKSITGFEAVNFMRLPSGHPPSRVTFPVNKPLKCFNRVRKRSLVIKLN